VHADAPAITGAFDFAAEGFREHLMSEADADEGHVLALDLLHEPLQPVNPMLVLVHRTA